MNNKQRKSGFIMVWPGELEEVKKIGASAYILRQVYRLHKDHETSISSISDLSIQKLIGWDRMRIWRAKKRLLAHELIQHAGYHRYYIPNHDIFKTCSETPQLKEKTCSETPQPHVAKHHKTCSETPQQLQGFVTVHNNKIRQDVVDTPNNTISPILKDDLKNLFQAQGQQGEALLVFFYTVAQERIAKGIKEGILRIAIKRAISTNSKATIQDILSNDSLTAIKAEQDRIKQKAIDDLNQAEALRNKAPDHVASDYIKKMKEAVK